MPTLLSHSATLQSNGNGERTQIPVIEKARLISSSDRTEAELIGLAWDCALKAYKPVATSQPERPERAGSSVDFSLPSSATGRIKATTCTIFTPPRQPETGTTHASYLVVAVRGSASKLDHIVNLNGDPRDAKALFVSPALEVCGYHTEPNEQKIIKDDGNSETPNIALHAHAGFLNSALELMKQLSNRVENRLKKNPRTNIIFTGHSAGGAVASLLHLSFRAKFKTTCKSKFLPGILNSRHM